MAKNPSLPPPTLTIEQPSLSPSILTIPEELFIPITSFMDTESQFVLAHTCTTLYEYHKNQCKEQTFTLICDPMRKDYHISEYIKVLEHRMSQTWLGICESHSKSGSVKGSEQL